MEQEIKEKLERSASKLDRPTPEMPGMHQPSAFSTKILVSKSIHVTRPCVHVIHAPAQLIGNSARSLCHPGRSLSFLVVGCYRLYG